MNHRLFLALAVALLAAACAAPPQQAAKADAQASSTDCAATAAALAQVHEAQRHAEAERQGAWKAVVPFVVAARYANASSAESQARERATALEGRLQSQGCEGHGR